MLVGHPWRRSAPGLQAEPSALVLPRNSLEWCCDPASPWRHPELSESLQALRYAGEPAYANDALLILVLAWVPPGGDPAERCIPRWYGRC
jgi:hypothetical protein